MKSRKVYNQTLNVIKGISCLLIVCMHCEFPGYLGILVQTISRYCVPFFFMVSGYYCFSESNEKKNIKKKILHILKITLYASLFYIVLTFIFKCFDWSGFEASFSTNSILNWLVFNQPCIGSSQMWFLWALLYAYILFHILSINNKESLGVRLIPILFISYILLAQGAHVIGIYIPNMYYRNFLIEGFPFLMMGYAIHKYQNRITLSNKNLWLILFVSTIACIFERILLGRDFGVNISSFPQVVSLFLLSVRNPIVSFYYVDNKVIKSLWGGRD